MNKLHLNNIDLVQPIHTVFGHHNRGCMSTFSLHLSNHFNLISQAIVEKEVVIKICQWFGTINQTEINVPSKRVIFVLKN